MAQKDLGSVTRLVQNPNKEAGSTTKVTGAVKNLSPKTIELGRSFLSALFMGLRTAQIHDPSNKAFERAVQGVRTAADQVFAATGGFSISFVEDSTFMNGVRLRFEGGQFDAMRTLRHILESRELGGIEMRAPPSYEAIRKLLLMFSSGVEVDVSRDDLLAAQIGMLGVQRFSDESHDRYRVDRRVFAVQSYAKLILAFREQRDAAMGQRSHMPRLRAVRIVQDLVELCGDRSDFLLRLGSNHASANVDELHAANVCVLSIALARALGLERQDMVEVGVAGLFHDLARSEADEPPPPPQMIAESDLMLQEGWDDLTREQAEGTPEAYQGEIEPLGDDEPMPLPIEYIGELHPIDPSEGAAPELEFPDQTAEGEAQPDELPDVERTAVTRAPDMGGDDPELLDISESPSTDDIAVKPIGSQGATLAPGKPCHAEEAWTTNHHPHTIASFKCLLDVSGVSRSGMLRALVAAEHHNLAAERYQWGEMRHESHPFSRIVAVVDAYDALTSGLGSSDGAPVPPIEALALLLNDRAGRVDGRIVDLLINVLRAYPVGAEVVLDNGERAVVTSHAGATRWDRPFVKTHTNPPRSIDLMLRDNDRFRARILGTVRSLGERKEGG